jgi:hypothetical protein
MPQLIGVKSLYKTCLDFVVNNMALLREKPTSDFDQLRKLATFSDLSISIFIFSYCVIANKLLEEIISALQSKGGLKPFLGILAVPHLETLNLKYSSAPYFGSADDQSIELDNSMRCVVRNFTFTLAFKSKHDTFSISELKTSGFQLNCF